MDFKVVILQLVNAVVHKNGDLELPWFNENCKALTTLIKADPENIFYLESFYKELIRLGESQKKKNTLLTLYFRHLTNQLTTEDLEPLEFVLEVNPSSGCNMTVTTKKSGNISNVRQQIIVNNQ